MTIDNFDKISLEEMADVRLMNRIDTKFVTTRDVLARLLELARDKFLVQEVEGVSNLPYYTLYYDTPEVKMFYDHQRGKKSRRKIRIRKYEYSNLLPFLEIKDKNNKGRTKKKRIAMESGDLLINYHDFIGENSEFTVDELSPQIENRFNRITLVDKEKTERITIDTSLKFHNFVTVKDFEFPDIAIIEWKRSAGNAKSEMKPLLHRLHISERSFSKYVVGMAITDPTLRQNRLKPKIRAIGKILAYKPIC